MRIGIIASARHPISEPFAGGLERNTYDLATGLQRRGHDVTVFAAEGSDPALDVEEIYGRECQIEFSEAALSDPEALSEPFMRTHHAYLHLMLGLRGRGFDVIQNSSLHYLPVSLAPFLDTPFVTTLHTPPTPWLESALKTQRDTNGSTMISVSRSNAAAWREIVDIAAVIPNGIDLEEWPCSYDVDPDTVLWTGRLVQEKGPHLAVEAAHAAGKRIVLAGPLGHDGYAESEVLARLAADDEYVGHLGQDELARLVGSCGVFVCTPTWEEPFGLVVAEALACGTPVAAFDRGAIHEIVDEHTGVLVPADDVAALADAIGRAERLDRSTCRARAEAEFSVDLMVDRYERLYGDLLA